MIEFVQQTTTGFCIFRASAQVDAFFCYEEFSKVGKMYRKMYFHLFNAATGALYAPTKEVSDEILRKAKKEVVEMYPEPLEEADNRTE